VRLKKAMSSRCRCTAKVRADAALYVGTAEDVDGGVLCRVSALLPKARLRAQDMSAKRQARIPRYSRTARGVYAR